MKPDNTEVLDRLHALMHGLGPMEARCLGYFMRNDGGTQRDLVQHAGRDKAQIARIVKSLLDRGLLVSSPDPNDGRSQRLSVTAAGQALQRRMQQHRARFEKTLTAGLTASERSSLLALLDRLQDNVGSDS